MSGPSLWGKYRGTVEDNVDIQGRGRLLCTVPVLSGMLLNWASACVPYAGAEVGLLALPPIGAEVWIEFEQGDAGFPIWTGCTWPLDLAPVAPPHTAPAAKLFVTSGCTLVLDDTPDAGGITLAVSAELVGVPVSLTMNADGAKLSVGEVQLVLNAETGISMRVAETTVTITEEGVTAETPNVTVTTDAAEVTGAVTVKGAVEITGETTITGAVEVAPSLTLDGALVITTGPASLGPLANVDGALSVEGDANVVGILSCEGDSNVAGALTVEGDVNMAGSVQIEGNAILVGLLDGMPPL